MKKFAIVLGTLLIAGIAAYAGDLADSVTQAVPQSLSPTGNGEEIPGWVVPVVIFTLLAGVAVLSQDDNDDEEDVEAS